MRFLSALTIAVVTLVSLPVLATPDANAPQISRIASVVPGRDFTVEGGVQTLWETTFLLKDRSGEIIVDLGQLSPYALGLRSRAYIQVSGHINNGRFVPIVLVKSDGSRIMFTGPSTYAPLDASDVRKNTNDWVLTSEQIESTQPHQAAPAQDDSASAAETAPTQNNQ